VSTITPTEPMTMPADPAPSPAFVLVEGGDQRTVFRGVDWHTYNQLSEATGEGQYIRLIYDGRTWRSWSPATFTSITRNCSARS